MPCCPLNSLPRRATFFAFLTLVIVTRCFALAPVKTYAELTLKDGRQLKRVEVLNYTANGIFVRHADGLTILRTAALPDAVIRELHLPFPKDDELVVDPALADRPALVESNDPAPGDRPVLTALSDDLANRPAIADAPAASPTDRPDALAETTNASTANADAIASDAPTANESQAPAGPAPAGEGNIPEFFTNQQEVAVAATPKHVDLSGRVAVVLPSGETRLMGDVEVKAYPPELLDRYLAQSKARADEIARQLASEAAAAQKNGRFDEAAALIARANETVSNYLNFLPVAPFTAHTDEFGYFTLRHDGGEVRLVAAGRVALPQGEWTYEWTGVAAEKEILLTEANATAIGAPPGRRAQFAAR